MIIIPVFLFVGNERSTTLLGGIEHIQSRIVISDFIREIDRWLTGNGLVLRPVKSKNIKGFYVKHEGKVYQENELGSGILHGLFGKIPLLNILF